MSLFTNPIRPAPIASDAAVRRYLDVIRREIEPDPLYRRRLRGEVVNRFVAQKRGMVLTGRRRTNRMGALGRACLYASFALAVSVTGVMAASDAAIPGDVLYPLKRGIEAMRLEVLPAQYRDELAAYALSERIGELSQLVEAGDLARASTLAGPIHDAYEQAVAESDDAGLLANRIDRQLAWLEQVASGLPEQARATIARAMAGAPELVQAWESAGPGLDDEPGTSGQGVGSGQGYGPGSNGGRGADAPADDPSPEATPKPDPTPKADHTPKPEPTPGDDAGTTPKPSPKGQAKGLAPAP